MRVPLDWGLVVAVAAIQARRLSPGGVHRARLFLLYLRYCGLARHLRICVHGSRRHGDGVGGLEMGWWPTQYHSMAGSPRLM